MDFILRIYYFLCAVFWSEEPTTKSFRNLFAQVEKVLVIIPLDENAADATVAPVRALVESGKKVTVLLHHHSRCSFPNDYKIHFEEYYDTDLLFKKIPKFAFLKKLRSFPADLVIDLDVSDSCFTSFCALPVKAMFKAGLCRKFFEQSYSIRMQKINEEQSTIPQNYVDLLFSL